MRSMVQLFKLGGVNSAENVRRFVFPNVWKRPRGSEPISYSQTRHCQGDGVCVPHVMARVRSGRPKRVIIESVLNPTLSPKTRSAVNVG